MRRETKKQKSKEDYFITAINLSWARRAGCLAGHALHVALAIWHHKGLLRKEWGQPFPMGIASAAENFGVSRSAVARGLKELEKEGLIKVKRQTGVKTMISVLKPMPLKPDDDCGIPSADESFFENLEKKKEYSSHICKDVL